MPEMSSYPPGTPCWIDLAAPDIDAAKSFYGGLFGWESQEVGSTEETRGYHFFTLNGKLVAGFGPPGEGEPPSWRSYVAVEDAGETAGKAKEAGGEVLLHSTEVLDVGRMAVFRDTEGAVICAWQPARHHGAELANEPGAFSWAELATRDPDAAKSFYSSVFGWNTVDREMGPITYVELQVDGRAVGGMLPLTEGAPEEIPPHWLVYFAVDDFDGAMEKAGELGGGVVAPKRDTPAGSFGVLRDPNGAGFAAIELSERARAASS
jgi:uncharacterized protein